MTAYSDPEEDWVEFLDEIMSQNPDLFKESDSWKHLHEIARLHDQTHDCYLKLLGSVFRNEEIAKAFYSYRNSYPHMVSNFGPEKHMHEKTGLYSYLNDVVGTKLGIDGTGALAKLDKRNASLVSAVYYLSHYIINASLGKADDDDPDVPLCKTLLESVCMMVDPKYGYKDQFKDTVCGDWVEEIYEAGKSVGVSRRRSEIGLHASDPDPELRPGDITVGIKQKVEQTLEPMESILPDFRQYKDAFDSEKMWENRKRKKG
tara:strand:+ start:107 stop:886 length:780 start_codon:yes stop_codon:yes gene_type:complete